MIEYTRLYGSAASAERAYAELKREGYADDLIALKAPGTASRYWSVSVQAPFGSGRDATDILDEFDPVGSADGASTVRDPGLDAISYLSGPVSPGAISRLSSPKSPGAIYSLSSSGSPGAISRLSSPGSPGAISRLSGRVSPGSISSLSRRVSPGAISKLSGPVSPGAISRLSK